MGKNQMNKYFSFVLLVVGICSLFSACNSNVVFNDTVSFSESLWSKDNKVSFSYTIPDTSSTYSIQIEVENSDDYMYSNLFLFSTIVFPDSLQIRDTLECMLADYTGAWTGTGLWSYSNTFGFKKNIRFPKSGTYVFTIQQAMRCTNKPCEIIGIESVGLQIIKQ